MAKLTDKPITKALREGKSVRNQTMPTGVFLKCQEGRRLFIEDWGQDMGDFKPYLLGLECDTWYIVENKE